jgi:RNA polymerase sigma-70 factor (ECF subfamily)
VMSVDELLARYRRGETAAFDELLARHRGRLFGFLVRMLGERALAQDLFQETFLRFAREAARGKVRGDAGRWLFTVANRLALDALRRRSRWKMATDDDADGGEELAGSTAAPDAELAQTEMSERLRQAIARLPLEQRQVLLLRQDGDFTFREIAAMQGVPLGTALARMHRALKTLRKHLSQLLV